MTTPRQDPVAADRVLQRIATSLAELLDSAPGGVVEVRAHSLNTLTRCDIAVLHDGREETVQLGNRRRVLLPGLDELRDLTYTQGQGGWYRALIRVDADSYTATYDYDSEPDFPGMDFERETWAGDLERYPREPEAVPDWLRARLA